MRRLLDAIIVIPLGITLILVGCEQSTSEPVTTDMHEDFDHDHDHQHGAGHDHEHEHDDFEGSHSHPHTHGHRHGEPLHGGEIVSIGHSHHKDGATHYHAEVMPVIGDQIVFYVLTESEAGESKEHPVGTKEIVAYLNEEGADPAQATEVSFHGEGDADSARFQAEIPDGFADTRRFSIVIPKITLGGERLNFSFTAARSESTEKSDDAVTAEEPQP